MAALQPESWTDFALISLPFKHLWVFRHGRGALRQMENHSFNISAQVQSESEPSISLGTISYPQRGGSLTSAI